MNCAIGIILPENNSANSQEESKMSTHRLLNFFGSVALVIVVGLLPVSNAQATGAVESKMSATTGQGEGHVVISPTSQNHGTFAAEITVSIHNAQPNTTFSIQRAPDLMPDGICTGSYIPFGVTLLTSNDGAGAKHFHFERGAPLVSGVQFDVVFQAIGSDGSILQSDCMTVTVK
jgi:hypothetical protein